VVFIGVKIFSKISSLSRLLMGRLDPINFELEVSCHCSNVQFKHESTLGSALVAIRVNLQRIFC